MKKIILTILSSILTMSICFSQDIITNKSNEDIQAKILEVTPIEIKYKRFDNLEGPTFTLSKSDVVMVRYENGQKDIFIEENNPAPSGADLYVQGQADASRYYKGYKGAGTGTLITSLVSPLVGLIPAIACSSTPPNEINLNYPSADLMKNADYYNGFTQKSKSIKQGKVWTNWGIGLGANIVAVILLVGAQ